MLRISFSYSQHNDTDKNDDAAYQKDEDLNVGDPDDDDQSANYDDKPLAQRSDFASKVVRLISEPGNCDDVDDDESQESDSKVEGMTNVLKSKFLM